VRDGGQMSDSFFLAELLKRLVDVLTAIIGDKLSYSWLAELGLNRCDKRLENVQNIRLLRYWIDADEAAIIIDEGNELFGRSGALLR
jgi:hypothetical protein